MAYKNIINKKLFIAVIILQILVLTGMIGKRVVLLNSDKVVRLECVPVDPRSLFSGDYVILNFKITRLANFNAKCLDLKSSYNKNETVYVALEKSQTDEFWTVKAYSQQLKDVEALSDHIIRGKVTRTGGRRVKYGVEQYFVPQNEGKKIERNLRDEEITVSVDVALSDKGESAIKTLYMNGEEVVFH